MYLGAPMWGYKSAVAAFCSRAAWGLNVDGQATPVIVAAGTKISYTVRWENEEFGIENSLRGARVGLKGDKAGHVECKSSSKEWEGWKEAWLIIFLQSKSTTSATRAITR